MPNSGYLLLVEDEITVQENNRKILERRGYVLRQAYTLAEARALMAEEPALAIILDIKLPDGDAWEFLQELRKTSNVPVLLLTALGTPEDIIRGLEMGGDDYLTKPYDLTVFLKRVEALLRRASLIPEMLRIGPIKLDPASGRGYLYDDDMVLSQKEYSLLQQFVQHPGTTLRTEYLYERVWGQEMSGEENALKSSVYRLRKKLEGSGFTISSERNVGYCFKRETP